MTQPPSKHWQKIAEENVKDLKRWRREVYKNNSYDEAYGFVVYEKGGLLELIKLKEFYRKRFEKQEEVVRIAMSYLKDFSNMQAEDNFKDWKDKVENVQTWQEQFLNELIMKPINKHAKKAIASIHSLQSDE